MPLYDILNEFQNGSSHMAAVVAAKVKTKTISPADGDEYEGNKEPSGASELTTPLLSKTAEKSDTVVVNIDKCQNKQVNENKPAHSSEATEDGEEVIGIITLEDVFEELLQVKLLPCYSFRGSCSRNWMFRCL